MWLIRSIIRDFQLISYISILAVESAVLSIACRCLIYWLWDFARISIELIQLFPFQVVFSLCQLSLSLRVGRILLIVSSPARVFVADLLSAAFLSFTSQIEFLLLALARDAHGSPPPCLRKTLERWSHRLCL